MAPTTAGPSIAAERTPGEAPPAPAERRLTVFAAASLTEAFTDIGRAFEATHPGVRVAFNFGGSRALQTQIEEGAAADVFASASPTEIEALVASGHVAADGRRDFAGNRLVVILPRDNPAGIVSLADLARPGIKLVLAAEEVPVGRYARQVLEHLDELLGPGYAESVLANVVSNEDNVRQIVAKVALGEADAGMVYSTDAAADASLPSIPIEEPYNITAIYPLAILAGAEHGDLAAQFVAFVLSEDGQAVLAAHGFLPAESK